MGSANRQTHDKASGQSPANVCEAGAKEDHSGVIARFDGAASGKPAAGRLVAKSNGNADEPAAGTTSALELGVAYRLLKGSVDKAAEALEVNYLPVTNELTGFYMRAIESVYASAQATINLMQALGRASGPADFAEAHINHNRRVQEGLNRQAMDFFASARRMLETMAPPNNAQNGTEPRFEGRLSPVGGEQEIAERIKRLTEQQKRTLELLAKGLPNKLIAYEMGIQEATVKAHVGAVLKTLRVSSRAAAIVALANISVMSMVESMLASKSVDAVER